MLIALDGKHFFLNGIGCNDTNTRVDCHQTIVHVPLVPESENDVAHLNKNVKRERFSKIQLKVQNCRETNLAELNKDKYKKELRIDCVNSRIGNLNSDERQRASGSEPH